MFIDSHCHPNLPELKNRTNEVLANMHAANVCQALCIGVNLEDFHEVLALAENHAEFWASVGVHPEYKDAYEPSVEVLIEKAQHPKVIALGEAGLDYHWHSDAPEWQKQRFRTHIRAAIAIKKPIIVHTRQAIADTLSILKDEHAEQCGGIMHCFTEDVAAMKTALDLGFYISFSGIVSFKNAKTVHESARFCPLDRMLIETDAPYLAPVPHRGKINEPAFVAHTAVAVAALKNLPVSEIGKITTENFYRLFPNTKKDIQ